MSKNQENIISVIKYEGDNEAFIWKHPVEDFMYGAQLIVHENQEAIFFKDGQALDLFGPGRYTLETQKLPLLEKIYILPSGSNEVFHSEVYFINKSVQMAIKWGTPEKVRFIDPLTGVPLEIGASGHMNMQVHDSRKLLVKLVGTTAGISWSEKETFTKSLNDSFRPLISNVVKTNLSSVIKNNAIDILEIDENLGLISEDLKAKIKDGFEVYGLTIPEFYVNNIVLPEEDPNFKRIRELHTITLQTRMAQAEATIRTAQAQSQAQYRMAEEQSKAAVEVAHRQAELERQTTETEILRREAERKVLEAKANAEAQKLSGFAEAEIMAAKGYNQKDIIQADVQKAYAEGIGNMGPTVSGGGSGIVGDMLGMGVGLAAANTIAPQISGMMQNINPNNSVNSNNNVNTQPVFWTCSCGEKNNTGKFCSNCGNKRVEVNTIWNCLCGKTGLTGKFCDECGRKRGE